MPCVNLRGSRECGFAQNVRNGPRPISPLLYSTEIRALTGRDVTGGSSSTPPDRFHAGYVQQRKMRLTTRRRANRSA
jgi:hypothetical protein